MCGPKICPKMGTVAGRNRSQWVVWEVVLADSVPYPREVLDEGFCNGYDAVTVVV